MGNSVVLKGNLLYSTQLNEITALPDHYLVCENGTVSGVFAQLPERFSGLELRDYGDRLIIPGLVDLHMHAPQYTYRGLGMDMELLDWLNVHTFPEEAKYADLDYAQRAYEIFVRDLARSATTRISLFATIHREATELLMELLERSRGVKALVGKLNMDRNSPDYLREASAAAAAEDTALWIAQTRGRFQNVAPMITPRFTPSCTDALMERLGRLQRETGVPVQSHLSENGSEIALVQELCPDTRNYGETYSRYGLFGGEGCPTIMAHCVHCPEEEIDAMQNNGVFVAICAQSNTNICSGVAPVRTYLDRKMRVGLGTDIAGGAHLSVFRAMVDAIQASNLRWRLLDDRLKPLSVAEAFYLGTKGGGAFFGKVGSFEEGYECDAVVLDDENLPHPQPMSLIERLERLVYLSDERNVYAKFVEGQAVDL